MSKTTRFAMFGVLALASAILAPTGSAAPPPKEEKVAYIIVQVDAEYTVIRKADLKDFQKGINDKYLGQVKEHAEAKKDAVAKKQKFTTPPPKRPKVKQVPKNFTNEEEASEHAQQLKREAEEKAAQSPDAK
jgi:hypothetical protein